MSVAEAHRLTENRWVRLTDSRGRPVSRYNYRCSCGRQAYGDLDKSAAEKAHSAHRKAELAKHELVSKPGGPARSNLEKPGNRVWSCKCGQLYGQMTEANARRKHASHRGK